ncbi:hypothetical protein Plhal304r1_c055g0141431 [Plasmopara halstedii]
MQQYYSLEAQRATEFRELLESYLGIPVLCQNNEKSQNDGSIFSGMRGLLCMNLEVKLERGLGDAGMQNIAFYIHQYKFARYSEEYEIPALLVELEGPWLEYRLCLTSTGRLSMSICRLNFRWLHQPQTVLLGLLIIANCDAACLASLKRAVLALNDYYVRNELSKIPASCLPIGRYGDTVHRFCASKGNAPPLLSCELVSPNGIWWRVEMEEWELKSITEATNPDDAQSQLKLLLDELRENNFVHGDLRPPMCFSMARREGCSN